jgi:hypothetical protein
MAAVIPKNAKKEIQKNTTAVLPVAMARRRSGQ